MKKLTYLLLGICLSGVLLFTGCTKTEPTGTEQTDETDAGEQDTPAETDTPEGTEPADTGESEDASTPATHQNMLNAVQGEVNANANYVAFADVADAEGHPAVAKVFRALADAELKHSEDEYALVQSFGMTDEKPAAAPVSTGTTAENLQAAIDGETAEYTAMYPSYLKTADDESIPEASSIFNLAMQAEEVHAQIYTEILENFENLDASKYEIIYRCPICGNIHFGVAGACEICQAPEDTFIEY